MFFVLIVCLYAQSDVRQFCTFPETMANLAPGGLRGGWMLEETDAVTGVS